MVRYLQNLGVPDFLFFLRLSFHIENNQQFLIVWEKNLKNEHGGLVKLLSEGYDMICYIRNRIIHALDFS